MELLAILAFFVVSVGIYFFVLKPGSGSGKRLPPSPSALPIIGHLHLLASTTRPVHQILWDFSKKLGPLVHLRLAYRPTLVVSSAQTALEVLKTHDISFSSRPPLTFAQIILPDDIVFAPYGERWRELRKLCTLELFTVRRVTSFAPLRQAEVTAFMQKLTDNRGKTVDMSKELTKLVLGIMQTIIFGKSRRSDVDEFISLIHRANELGGILHIGDYIPSLKWLDFTVFEIERVKKKFHQFLQAHIDEHREQSPANTDADENSFVDYMLALGGLSDLTIRCVTLDTLSAGLDTTTTAIEWTVAEVVNHPEVLEKLRQELDSVIPENAVVTEADVPKLKYLQAIIRESLRLHPPAPLAVPRRSIHDCELQNGKFSIPADTQVVINLYAIGRDPKVWENASEFRPERMLHLDKPADLLTFGCGRRSCPGQNLGMAAVHLVVANLLYKFDWKTPDGQPVDFAESLGFTLMKAKPLDLIPVPRN